MENQKLILIIALAFTGLLLFQEWQKDYGTPRPTTTATSQTSAGQGTAPTTGTTGTPGVPVAKAPGKSDVPVATQAQKPNSAVINGEGNKLPSRQQVHVKTDTLDVVIDTFGGDIRQVDLLDYPATLKKNSPPFRIMTDKGAKLYVAQSGFSMLKGESPTHESEFTAEQTSYSMAPGQKELKVSLVWKSTSGVEVIKTYTFHSRSHVIDLDYKVINNSAENWQGSFYRQIQRTHVGEQKGSQFIYTYMGGAIYTPDEHFEKIKFEDMQEKNLSRGGVKGGWVGMMQHYFVGAWVPRADDVNTFYSNYLNYRYYIGMMSEVKTILPGKSTDFTSRYYIGPKDQDTLEKLSKGLELTVDYGILTVIAKPLFWLLEVFHKLTGNWGWAIILLTLSVKLAFYKLSETSYKSMANMRKVQPRMQQLKERYGDDRQKMNQALMELYKKEKINPLGGCLPILVQIPVFIALYWVLLESVEMRQAPWILWIKDLSAQDPYYILPIIMGVTMFIQQKLNPAPLDPVQAKVMMALPIVFTVFFLFFPSGLVLYWVVNNTLSILQQWVITKRIAGKV